MAIRLITPPTVEPVTLARAKEHLRVDHSTDDDLIQAMIEGARQFAEKFTARAFITQTWELVIDEFPVNEILLPLPPLQSIESIKYDDAAGVEQTLAASEYSVDDASEPGWVLPVGSWPTVFDGINSVRIRFVAGYDPGTDSPIDLAANVPASLKSGILLHVGSLYAQRESFVVGTTVVDIPSSVAILHMFRQYRVALGMA